MAGLLLAVSVIAGAAAFWALRGPFPASEPAALAEASLRAEVAAHPTEAQPRLALIGLLMGSGRLNDALDAAREAHKSLPETPSVRRAFSDALVATARVPEGIQVLRSLKPKTAADHIRLAGYLVREGQREAAAAELRGLQKQSPVDVVRAAQVYLDAFRPEEAGRLLRPSAEKPGGSLDLQTTCGLALILTGKYPEAARVLERAVEREPEAPTLRFYLGSAIRLGGDRARLPDAEEHLRRATQRVPSEALFQYELALARVQLRDWIGAREPLEAAARLKPDMTEAQRDLHRLYERLNEPILAGIARSRYLRLLGDAAAAAKEMEELSQRHPDSVELQLELAEAYYDAIETPKTLALVSRLTTERPQDLQVLSALFRANRAADHNDAALDALDRILKIAPDAKPWMVERGDLMTRLGRTAEVEGIARELRDRDPQDYTRHYQLGTALWRWSTREGRLKDAEVCFREAIRLQPDHAASQYSLGLVLEKTGRSQEAITHLRRALDLAPRTADALRVLGRAYTQVGDRARAAEALDLYRLLQARDEEQKRLEVPSSVHRATHEDQARLSTFYVRTGQFGAAIAELEGLLRRFPQDPESHRVLLNLYGHSRRFQRHYEERTRVEAATAPQGASS